MTILLLVVILMLITDIRFNPKKTLLKTTQENNSQIVIDTSALIDGRILDVVKSGFMKSRLVVSKNVLDELQLLADGKDSQKRERARFGLDVVSELQATKGITVEINQKVKLKTQTTDESLLKLSKSLNARLCTTDFNLNKVAKAEGLEVLNVNELAHALRPKALPGEVLEVKIVQKGESKGQGVGYLDDGTMTVIENSSRKQGKTVKVVVDRMIQTKAGKMIFGSLVK